MICVLCQKAYRSDQSTFIGYGDSTSIALRLLEMPDQLLGAKDVHDTSDIVGQVYQCNLAGNIRQPS